MVKMYYYKQHGCNTLSQPHLTGRRLSLEVVAVDFSRK